MDDYQLAGGSLKLKGVLAGGVKKKKSKSSKTDKDKDKLKQLREHRSIDKATTSTADDPEPEPISSSNDADTSEATDRKTAAERRFEAIQKQRRAERVAKLAAKTHKERVQEFNEKLESLSEHHDIPKVGPG